MYYAVTLEYPKDLPPDLGPQQRAALAELTQQGSLMLVGPFTGGGAGMAILRAASLEDATAIYGSTPFGRSGIVTWNVREWDARAGVLAQHLPTD